MRFRVLMSLLAFVLCLLPSHAKAAEQLQTAWIGEHEAFLVWYAKQKGWDKDAGLDIRMLRFGSGDKIVSRQGDYQWKIAGCGAVPTLMAASKGQFYVVGIGNDESDLNAIYVRPDSPILKAKGANPRYPDVYGSADTVRGKLILCPEKTSAHYLLSTWLHILGLKDEDVKIQNVLPGPAVDMYSKGFGDAVSIWAPATYTAAQKGYQIAASSPDCGIRQPILLLADREFADKNPEQVRAFLRVYLRVVDAMHSEGFDAFVQEYIRFNKTWNEKLMTREEAVEDLRAHPVFSLGEQITLFHPESGNLRNWLRGITAFYGRIGELSQEDVANLKAFGSLNASFRQGRQQNAFQTFFEKKRAAPTGTARFHKLSWLFQRAAFPATSASICGSDGTAEVRRTSCACMERPHSHAKGTPGSGRAMMSIAMTLRPSLSARDQMRPGACALTSPANAAPGPPPSKR